MSDTPETEIARLQGQLGRIVADLDQLVTGLSAAQLRWTPPGGGWGVADCLEHLNRAGTWFVGQVDRCLTAAKKAERAPSPPPFRPLLFERLYVWVLEPPVRRLRAKAPAAARPAGDASPEEVVKAFRDLQDTIRDRLAQAEGLDLRAYRTRSTLSKKLHFSLGGCLRVLLAHQRRHLWQARQVRDLSEFPAS